MIVKYIALQEQDEFCGLMYYDRARISLRARKYPQATSQGCNARWYDPEIGRFISEDPAAADPNDPLSLNRYIYCRNNPLIYVDPTGEIFGIDDFVFILICAVVAAIGNTIDAMNNPRNEWHGGNYNDAFWHGFKNGAQVGSLIVSISHIVESFCGVAKTADGVGRTDVAGQAQAGGSGVNGNTSGMTDVDMVNPIEGGKIRGTDSWGEGAYNSIRTSTGRHGAVDITAPPGTPVRAPYAGGIENIGSEMNVGVGLGGKIGEDVYYSRLLHIDSIVTNGQLVGKGQIIGYIQDITTFYDINMTNHVHWELYLSVGGMDRNIDPTKYIK